MLHVFFDQFIAQFQHFLSLLKALSVHLGCAALSFEFLHHGFACLRLFILAIGKHPLDFSLERADQRSLLFVRLLACLDRVPHIRLVSRE